MYVGKKLRQLRLGLDLNQEEMAKELGVSRSYYAAIEISKRKATKKMMDLIRNKWNVDEGYFGENKAKKDTNKLGGKIEGVLGGVQNPRLLNCNLKGEDKAILDTYNLIDKLFGDNAKGLETEQIQGVLLNEAQKLEDKTLYYYLRSTQELNEVNPKLKEGFNVAAEFESDLTTLVKIAMNYIIPLLKKDIEYIDFDDFMEQRKANFEALNVYVDTLKPLTKAIANFITDFQQFDKNGVLSTESNNKAKKSIK